jgi:hypothetical protein
MLRAVACTFSAARHGQAVRASNVAALPPAAGARRSGGCLADAYAGVCETGLANAGVRLVSKAVRRTISFQQWCRSSWTNTFAPLLLPGNITINQRLSLSLFEEKSSHARHHI